MELKITISDHNCRSNDGDPQWVKTGVVEIYAPDPESGLVRIGAYVVAADDLLRAMSLIMREEMPNFDFEWQASRNA